MKRKLLTPLLLACLPATAQQPAQKSMGTIATADAQISGGLEVAGPRARLITNASVTANDHNAQIDLDRGGLVAVCATSAFHLLRSGTGEALLFALDRGAMELHTQSRPQDAILTPDLRFTLLTGGPLDLRMRVTREGDTCVENRGDAAPVLQITEGFGDATYHLAPNQHVLFEHGSLREVVDRETSSCGCVASTPVMVPLSTANATSTATPQQAAALNPFPTAQSADLAPTQPSVPLPPLDTATPLALSNTTPTAPPPAAPPVEISTARAPSKSAASETSAEPPPSPPGAHDIFHAIGHFFRRLFGHKS